MGLKRHFVELIKNTTLQHYDTLLGLKMLELGNQNVRPNQGIVEKTGKQYWSNNGFEHISVDVNGKDGALVKDLTILDDFKEYENYFNVVYNSGTTEHVEPYEKQYECFKIIDMCCSVGGLMFHGVPEITNRDKNGMWSDHCHYYYSKEFFETLAKESKYDLLELEVSPRIITCVMKKTKDSLFIQDREKFLSGIHVRNSSVDFSNNTDYMYQKNYNG